MTQTNGITTGQQEAFKRRETIVDAEMEPD